MTPPAAALERRRPRRCSRSSAEAKSPNAAENLLVAPFEPVRHEHPPLSGAEGLTPFDSPVLDVVVAPPTPIKPPPVELLLLLLALPPLLTRPPPAALLVRPPLLMRLPPLAVPPTPPPRPPVAAMLPPALLELPPLPGTTPVVPPVVTLTRPPVACAEPPAAPPVPGLLLPPPLLTPPVPPVPVFGMEGPVNFHQLNLKRSPLPPVNFRNKSCFPLPPLTAQVFVVHDDAPETSHVPSSVPVWLSRCSAIFALLPEDETRASNDVTPSTKSTFLTLM